MWSCVRSHLGRLRVRFQQSRAVRWGMGGSFALGLVGTGFAYAPSFSPAPPGLPFPILKLKRPEVRTAVGSAVDASVCADDEGYGSNGEAERHRKIIGFVGPIGSGKSTAVQVLQELTSCAQGCDADFLTPQKKLEASECVRMENGPFVELAFATPLKSFLGTLGFTPKQLYGTQEDNLAKHPFWQHSAREVMQDVGTRLFREELPRVLPGMHDVWVRALEHKLITFPRMNVAVSDLRFKNEGAMLKNYGAYFACMQRSVSNTNAASAQANQHVSETEQKQLKCDFVIDNNGTIEDLREKLRDMLHQINKAETDKRATIWKSSA